MPVITLPDGSQRKFDRPVTVDEVAASIGAGLARAALAGRVNGKRRRHLVRHRRGRARSRSSPTRDAEGVEIIRHSTAHLLAQAVKQLFPEAQVTIGPVIEDGFYYDFSFKRPFTPEDLAAIETRMKEIAAGRPQGRAPRDAARRGGRVLPQAGRDLQGRDHCGHPGKRADQPVRAGRLGRSLPRPARAEHGQAQGVQADEGRGRVLARRFAQRDVAADLRHGLARREESRRLPAPTGRSRETRPSRASASELDFFHFQEEAPGAVFWHPKGWSRFPDA